MTNAQIAREFVEKGWQIRYRGGNSVCSTPSDLEIVVADTPGDPPRYSIAVWPSSAGPSGGPEPPTFDLYDAELGVAACPRPSGRRSCSGGTACRPTRRGTPRRCRKGRRAVRPRPRVVKAPIAETGVWPEPAGSHRQRTVGSLVRGVVSKQSAFVAAVVWL